MNKKGHFNGGLITTSLVIGTYILMKENYELSDYIELGLETAGIMFGSFLPDLDADKSYIRKKMKIVAFLYDFLKVFKRFRHRGSAMHSFWTWWSFLLVGVVFNSHFCIGVALGVFVHHILDMTTPAGLPNYFSLNKEGYSND